jgi:haloalkane dehalogenase
MDAYRTPDERFAGLPDYAFGPLYVEQDGLRMHYVQEGSGAPVLLLHGEPTWAFLYRKMIPRSPRARASSRPTTSGSAAPTSRRGSRTTPTTSTTRRSSGFADELDLATRPSSSRTGAARRSAARGRAPDRVARLVILNTGIGAGRAPSEEWLRFREFMRRVGTDLVPGQLVRSRASPTPATT